MMLFETWEIQGLPGLPFDDEPGEPTIAGLPIEPVAGRPDLESACVVDAYYRVSPDGGEEVLSDSPRAGRKESVNGFEAYLRSQGWPFVSITEARKAIFAGASLASFDFLVYSSAGPNHLVFIVREGGSPTKGQRATMAEWEKVFGDGFAVRFVRWDGGAWECRGLADKTWGPYRVENEEPER